MKKLIILLFLFTSCAVNNKYIICHNEEKLKYTWCDKIIKKNKCIYEIKKCNNKILYTKIYWYKNITKKEYWKIISRSKK